MINVEATGDNAYRVTVEGSRTTTHNVTLDPAYYRELTGGSVTPEALIERSFEFLLERESNTMILSSFELPVIGRYFPEYEREIKGRCSG